MCLFLPFSMEKRGPQPKSAKPQAPTRLPPHGTKDGNLRTPKHIADPAGGKDMYNVQDIIAERWHHGQIQYLVHWQGYSEAEDTWEPLAHLSDALEYVACWNEEKNKSDAEAELERQKKKQKAQEGSSSSNADTPQTPQLGPQRKQTSLVWKAFREATPQEGGKDFATCQVKKLDGTLCGQAICRSGGTSNLWSQESQERKDICVLAWWRNFRLSAPRLAEMARQFLATPASSAGIEGLFNAAHLTYGDLSDAMTEDTLAQRLLAMSNYSPALYIEGV